MARVVAALAITAVLGIAIESFAAPLSPSKPSQIVTVQGSFSDPVCTFAGGKQISLLLKPEGGTAVFAIPAKSVFVVTSYDWRVSGLSAGSYGVVGIVAVAPTALGTITSSGAIVGADGSAFGTGIVPNGMIVKPPATPCALFPFGTSSGSVAVHGFFAKDK